MLKKKKHVSRGRCCLALLRRVDFRSSRKTVYILSHLKLSDIGIIYFFINSVHTHLKER